MGSVAKGVALCPKGVEGEGARKGWDEGTDSRKNSLGPLYAMIDQRVCGGTEVGESSDGKYLACN